MYDIQYINGNSWYIRKHEVAYIIYLLHVCARCLILFAIHTIKCMLCSVVHDQINVGLALKSEYGSIYINLIGWHLAMKVSVFTGVDACLLFVSKIAEHLR